MLLDKKSFLNIIDKTPLCSIDILIKVKNKYLFGLRKNRPAKNYYFVPGGRILKNENYESTIKRILKNELSLSIKNIKYKLIGVYDHIYKDNVFSEKKINTHYFVCAILIEFKKELKIKNDNQHYKFILQTKSEVLKNKKIHKFSKIYFKNINKI